MKKIVVLIIVFARLCFLTNAQDTGDELFDNSFLHEIRFVSETIPNSELWDYLSSDYYIMVNMTIDGNIVDSVGLKTKGNFSNEPPQNPLKVDINEFVSGKKYDGLKKFNLHNNFMDTYLQREAIAYQLYRRAGLPSSRTAYAEVYVGDVFKGVYSITEHVDKTFLKHNFPSDDGSLYKGSFFEVQQGTMDEYNNYHNNVNATNVGDYLNLRNYLKFLAIDVIIMDFDSYGLGRHNFYLYYESKSERLNFITWDHNLAFEISPSVPNLLYPLMDTIIVNSNLIKPLYQQTMCDLLDYLLDSDYITDEANHNYNIINSNSNGVTATNPSTLIQYIADRKQWLLDKLDDEGVTCNELSFPLNAGDIVINEFVANSDSINGVEEPDGGTPDWIELYNNTNEDIALNEYYYLSDDKDFPKKWHFPEEVTISANDYLIVWADKDVHQQGIHAGFKIDKDGGDLLMTYEDMTGIQNVQFGEQELNMGYARVPNGTGDFVIQQHTFNANNGTVSVHELAGVQFVVYPNPATDVVRISSTVNMDGYKMILTNLIGHTVHSLKGETEIDVGHLPAGMYFLCISNGSEQKIIKIIKR